MGIKAALRLLGRGATTAFYGALFAGVGFLGWVFLLGPDRALFGAAVGAPVGLWLGWRHHRVLGGWGDGFDGVDF